MRIWTGRAGSGKTTAILREIAALSEKGEGRQILLVPELNSHLMERRLAAATHNHGARTAEVLTFSRLADRVFSEVGGLAQQMLTPAGQLLTLQEAARRVQGDVSAWRVRGRQAGAAAGGAAADRRVQKPVRSRRRHCLRLPKKVRTRYLQKNCPILHRF